MDRIESMDSMNFEMLRRYWPDLANLGGHAEKYVYDDPQSALIKLRCFAEKLVGIVYQDDMPHLTGPVLKLVYAANR